ncbi:leucine-rich repeat serine/threonine-protein kinase 1-like isoform X2 [Littorina saxatilis]|uniref:leucine-rich repeat serine/threonine-protein kinase 1-like isoform X2 n=1 Tax=Littorina saxatilis TaxID=31220 RepID=UPI0038B5A809
MASPENDLLRSLLSAVGCEDEKGMVEVLENCELQSLQLCLLGDPTLFIKVCAGGFLSAARYLSDNCLVDLTAQLEGRTALQWACLHGHVEIVELLLPLHKHNNLPTSAWQENSEFYSATLGGHMDIIQLLTEHFPNDVLTGVLKDSEVMQALLYAACKGGHLSMVRRWLLPSLDVNQPVQLVASLLHCEHRTPLHAACEGSHTEVAKLLMDHFCAEVSEHTAHQFPEFTASLVTSVYQPLQITDTEVKYNLRGVNIHTVHPVWIKPLLDEITHLDLSKNKLKKLDLCIPWGMRNLQHLDISHNRLVRLEAPQYAEDIVCHRLEIVNLSENRLSEVCIDLFQLPSLTDLNLAHNALQRLSQLQSPSTSTGSRRPTWYCPSLLTVNLSHNQLDVMSGDDLKHCPSITRLDLSHNKLASLPSPWDCPMEYLDVSYNQLERFPPSTEQFWSGSLLTLFLHNNQLDQLNENILKLGMLEKLNVSHNKVQYLAPRRAWDCPSLVELNLSHNCLGKAKPAAVDFPSHLLSEELRSLNLSDNQLIVLPTSVCYIKNLANLDISNNPLKDLPKELGNLRECWDLKVNGLNIKKSDLQEVVQSGKTAEIIEHLRKQMRNVQPCDIIKVTVIGPQGKGKSTVVEALTRGDSREVKLSDQPVTVTTSLLKSASGINIKDRAENDRPNVTLRIWELAGNPELLAIQPVLWSENSLFLLVWDMTEGTAGLSQWLCNIKSCLARVGVIIVATFKDRILSTEVEGKVQQFHMDINNLYGDLEGDVGVYPKEDGQKMFPHLCSVVFVTRHMLKQDVSNLRKTVYMSSLRLVKVVHPIKFTVGQLLPQSYLEMDRKLTEVVKQHRGSGRPLYFTQEEFDMVIKSVPAADFDTFDDIDEAVKVWVELGRILRYDVWSEGLSSIYFLDPNWLASMISIVLKPPGVSRSASYKQPMGDVMMRLSQAGFPSNIMRLFLQLLKHFDIGGIQQDSLLLPSLLPKVAPGLQLSCSQDGRSLHRFYAMPHVPSRLWSRLILSLLMSVDRFSQSCWQGLRIEKPQLTYWQEGLTMRYNGGSVVIESAVFRPDREEKQHPGILISILTDSSTLADLAIIGFVTDEIDSALQTLFPHYNDNRELFGIYALCPVCFRVRPCEGMIQGAKLHFALSDCAGDVLCGPFTNCEKGYKVALEDLIPEFLMGDLPDKFHLNSQDLQLKERLAGGAVGTVYKGILHGNAVAVKVFYRNPCVASQPVSYDSPTSDSGTSTMSSTGSHTDTANTSTPTDMEPMDSVYGNFRKASQQSDLRRMDSLDSRNLKVCRAFAELRQETVILSQLRHPCLISLLGVSVRPSLLVALEFAPFGSLRSVLTNYTKDRPFNKYHYQDRDKTFSTVLEKDITFKIIHQVAVGLEYLHNTKIIYRDLKCDNILVCALESTETINVKISDYGISKFTTSQGMMGIVGTPGYMAPEIMDGQAYNEKVDIFSFSMVIYELLTGHPPFEKYGRLHQIHHLVNSEKRRPSLKEYNVISSFPYLETLMRAMWAHNPHQRPSATQVVHQMEDVSFVVQHSHLVMPTELQYEGSRCAVSSSLDSDLFCNVTCAWALKETNRTASITGRNNVWVWESPTSQPEDRRLTVHNLASGKAQATTCRRCSGPPVTCMARVGQHMWVGVQDGSVEVYGSHCTDLTKGKSKLDKLGAEPVAIIHDRDNPNKKTFYQGGEGFVYVGLSNGTVQIFLHHPSRRDMVSSQWKHHKTLTISTDLTLRAMSLVPAQRELAVACGHSIIIVSTDTLLVEKRICLLKHLHPSMENKVSEVHSLVRNEDTLWCSFLTSPLILELELSTWKVSGACCLEADLEVFVTDVKLGGRGHEEGVCTVCRGSSFFVPRESKAWSQEEKECDKPKTEEQPVPPPRPPECTKPQSPDYQPGRCFGPSTAETANDPSGVQLRHKSRPAGPKDADNKKTDSMRCDAKKTDSINLGKTGDGYESSHSHAQSSHREVFSDTSETPPLPPPRRPTSESPRNTMSEKAPLSRKKSHTLPNLSTRRPPPPVPALPPPPPRPPRRSLPSEHEFVHVQSLLAVKDTLWVGSSCGEILVIGVKKRSSLPEGQLKKSKISSPSSLVASVFSARMSLNLESKQMCNLKSVKMNVDAEMMESQDKTKSGGIQMMLQARNLVVAVRNVTQAEETQSVSEIAVWEACSAERISSVRHYWQALHAMTE